MRFAVCSAGVWCVGCHVMIAVPFEFVTRV